jgi:hypothetical protein
MEKTPQLPPDLQLFLAAYNTLANRDPEMTRDVLRVTTETLPHSEQIKVARLLHSSTSPNGRALLQKVMRGDA